MKIQEIVKLGDAIKLFILRSSLREGIETAEMEEIFRSIAGKTISKYVKNIHLQGNCMYVTLSSSVVRQEISYLSQDLCKKMNTAIGKQQIEKIIFR